MNSRQTHVVTGAFGYSGHHIAQRLLSAGHRVLTLTGHPDRPSPLRDRIEALPFHFDSPAKLTESLRGVKVLINTYWVRFDHGKNTHAQAVENTKTLFRCAAEAGVERIVHVSITNPSLDSHLPYFRGKAELEQALRGSGVSWAILRPTVLFGGRDVLINNIAWLLRRFPVFGVAGDGTYRLQPIHVEDLARLAVEAGESRDNVLTDAVGPEIYSFDELVSKIGSEIGRPRRLMHMPGWFILLVSKMLGAIVRDVPLTGDEVDGLSANLLVSSDPPTGEIAFSDWLSGHSEQLGLGYANELARHFTAPALVAN
jgi:NADH dehydrogenase